MIMNTIKCVSWRDCEPLWKEWIDKKNNTPEPINTNPVYVDLECISGSKTPKRTLAFIRNDPSDPTTEKNIIGCVIIYDKKIPGLEIGGIGKMAVDPLYRKNNVSSKLMEVCLAYMHNAGFDISLLWASVLKVYEKHGYVAIRGTNTMYRPIKGLPSWCTIDRIMDLHKEVGVW